MTFRISCGRISFLSDLFRRSQNAVKGVSTDSLSFKSLGKFIVGSTVAVDCQRRLFTEVSLFKEQSAALKKRPIKKKKVPASGDGLGITAFSTAEEYNLESLLQTLSNLTSFKSTGFLEQYGNLTDVIHAVRNAGNQSERQDLFFFRKGSVVMWNISDLEKKQIFDLLKLHEQASFSHDVVQAESEIMPYAYSDINNATIMKDIIMLPDKNDIDLEKYAISNAMALSVHLGTYEATLDKFIGAMAPVTEDLKSGRQIKMTRDEVLQRTGQLFALRHNISLSSDLVDTPDFYWDRPELENVYQLVCNYFCISKRTKIMNEKINHCIELVELLSSHLNDKHHVRLEWMIIILIMVEVAFEVAHYIDRYLESNGNVHNAVVYQSH